MMKISKRRGRHHQWLTESSTLNVKPVTKSTSLTTKRRPQRATTRIIADRNKLEKVGELLDETLWVDPLHQGACSLEKYQNLYVYEPIGRGSFGTVFRVRLGNQSAALKCVKKSALFVDRTKESFKVKAEFAVWRVVSEHPNIVHLMAFLQTDKNWCFVMEYANLGSLSCYLKEVVRGPLSVQQSQRLAAQLAHAIFCLHQLGFLHRDISCSNVLLVRSEHPFLLDAKLADFGLSLKASTSSSRCGSLAYMSPEVLNRDQYSTDADWWSYGIVVYCMFVGRTPLSVFAKKEKIELSCLSRNSRYDLAKTVTIHISRDLEPEQRSFLVAVLQDKPWDRLGVWRYSYPDGSLSDTLEPLRQHEFLRSFDWSTFDGIEEKLSLRKKQDEYISQRLDAMVDPPVKQNSAGECGTSRRKSAQNLHASILSTDDASTTE